MNLMHPANPHLRQHPQQSSPHESVFAAVALPADRRSTGDDVYSPRQSTYHRSLRFGTICAGIGAIVFVSSVAWWPALASSFPLFAFKSLATDTLTTSSSLQPWVGHHALVPHLTPNSSMTHYHVRIIIRVHHGHKELVHGLIHNMRHQQQLLVSPSLPTLSMDFALVPTEQRGVPVTQGIARDFWLNPFDPFPHVYAVNLNENFFAAAFDRAAPLKCTSAEETEIAQRHNEQIMRKICDYDNHVYYQATDVALRDLLQGCLWCTHVLVTNDDNCYHPDYFKETLLELDPPLKEGEAPRPKKKKRKRKTSKKKDSIKPPSAESQMKRKMRALAAASDQETGKGWDLVTTDFTTKGFFNPAEWLLTKVDLGSVLFSKRIVGKVGGFIAALPPHARAIDAHNADWLFTEKGLKMGGVATVVKKLLFFHN